MSWVNAAVCAVSGDNAGVCAESPITAAVFLISAAVRREQCYETVKRTNKMLRMPSRTISIRSRYSIPELNKAFTQPESA